VNEPRTFTPATKPSTDASMPLMRARRTFSIVGKTKVIRSSMRLSNQVRRQG